MSATNFDGTDFALPSATHESQVDHPREHTLVRILPLAAGGRASHASAQTRTPAQWRPTLGAWLESDGARFRVWAPHAANVEVLIEAPHFSERASLQKYPDGTFGAWVSGVSAGAQYRYRVDGQGAFPDPASRFQPQGVHGPSEVIDASRFAWTDAEWRGVGRADLVLYELHVGAFSSEGTFSAVVDRLPYLAALGATAIELMPVADFHGQRNWGYDGVDLFAPARCYGTPDDLRRLVNEAHRHGLAIFLDVVYNHLGPEGNYLAQFSPYYFSDRHSSPWGAAINLDGPQSSMVRQFFIENALHWIHEYHIDGLRLDATHAMRDDGSRHFVTELAARIRESSPRPVYIIAEDCRNLSHIIRPEAEGGWGLDGVWADDFHHKVRVALAGDRDGYYADYTGSMSNIARTLNRGWHYTGQFSRHLQEHRGTDPAGVPLRRFVFCIQNHDQVGNRALGERLHHQIDMAPYRAASALLLCAPATPLMFMGQEWGATTPFQYFTDHPQELGRLVTEGRRREFGQFCAFSDPVARERIPDPQAETTFAISRLDWNELQREPHASLLRLYQRLLALRQQEQVLRSDRFEAFALNDTTLLLRQDTAAGTSLLTLVNMRGASEIDLAGHPAVGDLDLSRSQLALTTEDPPFATDPHPPAIAGDGTHFRVGFARPCAVLLYAWPLRASGMRVGTRTQTSHA